MTVRMLGTSAALSVAAAAVLLAWTTADDDGEQSAARASAPPPPRLTATDTSASSGLLPGSVVSGSLVVTNSGTTSVQLVDVVFGEATSDACSRTGVALAPTVPPTPESPLAVPAGGSATLGWTAYMDGESDDDCQGATLTSVVHLDGEQAGAVTLTAGEVEQPAAPTGGLTTSTRAAVRWSASTAAAPGWVLERAVAGTADWRRACGSSPEQPIRALSCTDTGLTKATTYVYRVTLRTGHWHATSRPSRPVTTQVRPSS